MDRLYYSTDSADHKRGQHLTRENRGAIALLHKLGYKNRAIARELNCSPTTIGNELKRGTPARTGSRGRFPQYRARLGQAVYEEHRKHCRKQHRIQKCGAFLKWCVKQVKERKWSFDSCVGYARLHGLFPREEMVSTKTLYNELWSGNLPIGLFDVPAALKRRRNKHRVQIRGNRRGRSIDERPPIAEGEPGHWEGDTVVGRKKGHEAVILTLIEKASDNYLAIRIPGKTSAAVNAAMLALKKAFDPFFSSVFKSITVDNGPEFEAFAENENLGTTVFFAHPYSSWERPQNERHNGMLREFIPKGVSIENYGPDDILAFADELNSRPRKKLGYQTPEEVFDAFLDTIYRSK